MAKLFLVPTPIGNLQDLTFRALEVLKTVDLILAEDTRHSSKLLLHYNVNARIESFHLHNEHKKLERVVESILEKDLNVALISDAGSPGISDPGFLLCRECIRHNILVEALPGATAFVPALTVSGIGCERFVFEGFLPVKKGRQSRLRALIVETRTMVFYVSPHKLIKDIIDFQVIFGAERNISVSREISKLHEETFRGTLNEALTYFSSSKPKGEFVIVVQGNK